MRLSRDCGPQGHRHRHQIFYYGKLTVILAYPMPAQASKMEFKIEARPRGLRVEFTPVDMDSGVQSGGLHDHV